MHWTQKKVNPKKWTVWPPKQKKNHFCLIFWAFFYCSNKVSKNYPKAHKNLSSRKKHEKNKSIHIKRARGRREEREGERPRNILSGTSSDFFQFLILFDFFETKQTCINFISSFMFHQFAIRTRISRVIFSSGFEQFCLKKKRKFKSHVILKPKLSKIRKSD